MLTWVCTPQGASGSAANALKEHFGYYLLKKYRFFFFKVLDFDSCEEAKDDCQWWVAISSKVGKHIPNYKHGNQMTGFHRYLQLPEDTKEKAGPSEVQRAKCY